MNTEDYVKFIFSKMVCSCCNEQFTPESIDIIRIEGNCAIVKIECSHCHKDYGIAVVGIEMIDASDVYDSNNNEESIIPNQEPISYDDIIEAHNFIENLGADWTKYIPDEYKNINEE